MKDEQDFPIDDEPYEEEVVDEVFHKYKLRFIYDVDIWVETYEGDEEVADYKSLKECEWIYREEHAGASRVEITEEGMTEGIAYTLPELRQQIENDADFYETD